jgi:hypothetical protein
MPRTKEEWDRWIERNNNIDPEVLKGVVAILRWFDIQNAEGSNYPSSDTLMVDIDHSVLLHRLLSGIEPLPFPPPCKSSYPWYELIEKGFAKLSADEELDEVHEHFSKEKLVIAQNSRWKIVEKLGKHDYIVCYDKRAGNWRCHKVNNEWHLEKINNDIITTKTAIRELPDIST